MGFEDGRAGKQRPHSTPRIPRSIQASMLRVLFLSYPSGTATKGRAEPPHVEMHPSSVRLAAKTESCREPQAMRRALTEFTLPSIAPIYTDSMQIDARLYHVHSCQNAMRQDPEHLSQSAAFCQLPPPEQAKAVEPKACFSACSTPGTVRGCKRPAFATRRQQQQQRASYECSTTAAGRGTPEAEEDGGRDRYARTQGARAQMRREIAALPTLQRKHAERFLANPCRQAARGKERGKK